MPKMVLPPPHFSVGSEFSGFLLFTKKYGQMVPDLFLSASIYTRAFAFVLVSLHILHQITFTSKKHNVSLYWVDGCPDICVVFLLVFTFRHLETVTLDKADWLGPQFSSWSLGRFLWIHFDDDMKKKEKAVWGVP